MPCPACAPNAVDVVCGGSRHVIVYDGVDAYEVHASPYEVRGDQHPCAPTPAKTSPCSQARVAPRGISMSMRPGTSRMSMQSRTFGSQEEKHELETAII
eukprot:61667-Pelagomonas_calceolata.AAC.6